MLITLAVLVDLLVAAPPASPVCQALINLDTGGHLRVTVSDAPTVEPGRGWIAHDGARWWSLFSVAHQAAERGPYGSMIASSNELFAEPWPDGVPVKLAGQTPTAIAPQADDVGPEWTLHEYATIRSIIGPFVSVSLGAGGFTGGAHEIDDVTAVIRDLRKEGPVSLVALLGAAVTSFKAEVDAAAKAYIAGGGGGDPPAFDSAILGVLSFNDNKLWAKATLPCCLWVENHNQEDVLLELSAMPKPLAAYGGWAKGDFVAPNRCGAVQLGADGVVVVTLAGDRKVVTFPDYRAAARPLGVTWFTEALPAADRLRSALRTWSDPRDDLVAATEATREKNYDLAITLFRDVLAVEPLNAKAATGLGHALFLAKDYRASAAASRLALACDPSAAQRGAIGYNLGMALEALGDKAAALKAYEDSLKARPNPVVEKRYNKLK